MSSREPIFALSPIRFERRGPIHLVGLLADVRSNDGTSIPAQWGDFANRLDDVPARSSTGTVGALFQNEDESIEYLCAVEVDRAGDAPAGLSARTLPSQHYAVFQHDGHVSGIRDSWHRSGRAGFRVPPSCPRPRRLSRSTATSSIPPPASAASSSGSRSARRFPADPRTWDDTCRNPRGRRP